MEWIEVQAKSLDEAVELALDRLGVVADELEYEVIDEPRTGLFGRLGRGNARIRARVKPLSREKPADKRRRRRGSEHRSGNGGPQPRDDEDARSAAAREGSSSDGSGDRGRSADVRREPPPAFAEPQPFRERPAERIERDESCRQRGGGEQRGQHSGAHDRRTGRSGDPLHRRARPGVRPVGATSPPRWWTTTSSCASTARVPASACSSGPKGATLQALEELVRGGRPARGRRAERPPAPRRRRLPGTPPGGLGRVRRAGRERGAGVRERACARADEPARPEGRARHGRRARRRGDHVGGRGTAPPGRDQARLSGSGTPLPDPDEDALLVVLERARARGYLGPGPVAAAPGPRARLRRGCHRCAGAGPPTGSSISAAAAASRAGARGRLARRPG